MHGKTRIKILIGYPNVLSGDAVLCSLIETLQRNLLLSYRTRKVQTTSFNETLVAIYQTARRHIPEDSYVHRRENLHTVFCCVT